MSNANPLIPQGSLLERKSKGKPHLRVAYIIVAIHLVFLGGLLIQGCKREDETAKKDPVSTNETGLSPLPSDSLYNTNTGASPVNSAAQDIVHSAALTSSPASQSPAPISTPVEPAASPANREYVAVKGDSFYSIGKKFGVSDKAIARANPGIDPLRLKPGDKLQIPAAPTTTTAQASIESGGEFYVVKTGDTLSQIAKAHTTSVTEIKSLNALKTDRINVGQKLKMPAKSAPAAATSAPAGTPPPLPAAGGNP